MSDQLTLTPQEWFANDGQIARLQPLIADCMRRQGSLTFELSAQIVQLRVEDSDGRGAPLRLTGQPSVPDLKLSSIDDVGAKLILPLLFDIQALCLPHRQIFYLGRRFRSVAEFFGRNLFLAAVRNVSFEIQVVPTHQFSESVNKFKHEYYFILKQMLPEDKLKGRNAVESIDLIALNAYLDAQYFSRALLNRHLGSAHAESQQHCAGHNLATLKMRLLETRSALFAQG